MPGLPGRGSPLPNSVCDFLLREHGRVDVLFSNARDLRKVFPLVALEQLVVLFSAWVAPLLFLQQASSPGVEVCPQEERSNLSPLIFEDRHPFSRVPRGAAERAVAWLSAAQLKNQEVFRRLQISISTFS